MEKYRGDRLINSNTFCSYLRYTVPASLTAQGSGQVTSPSCGFGWLLLASVSQTGSSCDLRFSPGNFSAVDSASIQAAVSFKSRSSGLVARSQGNQPPGLTVSFPMHSNAYYNDAISGLQRYDASRSIGVFSAGGDARTSYNIITVELQVSFSTLSMSIGAPPISPVESNEKKLKHMLRTLLSGEEVTTAKFYLFSRRSEASGEVYGPRALFANAELIRGKSDELDQLLFGEGFREAAAGEADLDVTYTSLQDHEKLQSESYDLADDSDLEGDEVDIPNSEHASWWGYGEDDTKKEEAEANISTLPASTSSNSESGSKEPVQASGNSPIAGEAVSPPKIPREPRRQGRVVAINGHAYQTWNAFLFYLMTGTIKFKSLSSADPSSSNGAHVELEEEDEGDIACSPKSMYHLAQKFGVPELSQLALEHFKEGLSDQNIIQEAFGTLPNLYPEMTEVVSAYIQNHMSPGVAGELDKALKRVVPKMYFDVVSSIVQKLHGHQLGHLNTKKKNKGGKRKK